MYERPQDGVPTVYLVIGCDTDPDRAPEGRTATDAESYWSGVTSGIPALRAELNRAGRDDTRITWLLRSDRQMRLFFGSYAYPAERYAATWRAAAGAGDEIGWHPHLWDWDDARREWFPSLWDDEIVAELPSACAALRQLLDVTSTRTGWTHCSNAVMRALRDARIRVDFSAMPGQAYVAFTPEGMPWFNDWRLAPDAPYRPSTNDYRAPGTGAAALDILEIPVTPIPITAVRAAARWGVHALRWRRARKRVGGAPGPWSTLPRYVRAETHTVTAAPALLRPSMEPVVRRARREGAAAFVTYFHTDEILDARMRGHFVQNVVELHRIAGAHGVRVSPLTATQLAQLALPA